MNWNYVSVLKTEWTLGLFPRSEMFSCVLEGDTLKNNLPRKYINKRRLSLILRPHTLLCAFMSRLMNRCKFQLHFFWRIPMDKTSLFFKLQTAASGHP